jgi:hypothetical protein
MTKFIRRLAAGASAIIIVLAAGTTASASAGFSLNGDSGHAFSFCARGPVHAVDFGDFTVPGGASFSMAPYGAGVFSGSYEFTSDKVTITAGSLGADWGDCSDLSLSIDVSPASHINSFTVDGLTTVSGITPLSPHASLQRTLDFTRQAIVFDFRGQIWSPGQSAVYDLQLGNNVPEPATWAMLLVGFGGVGAVLRGLRRKQAATVA